MIKYGKITTVVIRQTGKDNSPTRFLIYFIVLLQSSMYVALLWQNVQAYVSNYTISTVPAWQFAALPLLLTFSRSSFCLLN